MKTSAIPPTPLNFDYRKQRSGLPKLEHTCSAWTYFQERLSRACIFLLPVLVSTALASCEKEPAARADVPGPDVSNGHSEVGTNIEYDIMVHFYQREGHLILFCETDGDYGETVNSIDYELKWVGNMAIIEFKRILYTGAGQSIGPAWECLDLGELRKGPYKLIFRLNGQSTTADLTVDNPAELEIAPGGNVKPLQNLWEAQHCQFMPL